MSIHPEETVGGAGLSSLVDDQGEDFAFHSPLRTARISLDDSSDAVTLALNRNKRSANLVAIDSVIGSQDLLKGEILKFQDDMSRTPLPEDRTRIYRERRSLFDQEVQLEDELKRLQIIRDELNADLEAREKAATFVQITPAPTSMSQNQIDHLLVGLETTLNKMGETIAASIAAMGAQLGSTLTRVETSLRIQNDGMAAAISRGISMNRIGETQDRALRALGNRDNPPPINQAPRSGPGTETSPATPTSERMAAISAAVSPFAPRTSPDLQNSGAVSIDSGYRHITSRKYVTVQEQLENFDSRTAGQGLPSRESKIRPANFEATFEGDSTRVDNVSSQKALDHVYAFERNLIASNELQPLLLETTVLSMLHRTFVGKAQEWLDAKLRSQDGERYHTNYKFFIEIFARDFVTKAFMITVLRTLKYTDQSALTIGPSATLKNQMEFLAKVNRNLSTTYVLSSFFRADFINVSPPGNEDLVQLVLLNISTTIKNKTEFVLVREAPGTVLKDLPVGSLIEKITAVLNEELDILSLRPVALSVPSHSSQSSTPTPVNGGSRPPARVHVLGAAPECHDAIAEVYAMIVANIEALPEYEDFSSYKGEDGDADREAVWANAVSSVNFEQDFSQPLVTPDGYIYAFQSASGEVRDLPRCWACNEMGHFSRDCAQKPADGSLPFKPAGAGKGKGKGGKGKGGRGALKGGRGF